MSAETHAAVTIDSREFMEAMRGWSIASRKSQAEGLNHGMMAIAIQGVKLAKQASADRIRALTSLPWWNKYISKQMGKAAGGLAGYSKFQARKHYQALQTLGFGGGKFGGQAQRYLEAAKKSAMIIKGRLGAITFLRFFFVTMAKGFRGFASGEGFRYGKGFSGFEIVVSPATDDNPRAECVVQYAYKHRSTATARKAEQLLDATLAAAIPAATADMAEYTNRKLAEAAMRFSAK